MKRCLIIALSMLLTSSFAASTSEKIINSTGGNSASDGLRIYIGNKSNVQVVAYSDFSTGAVSTPQLAGLTSTQVTTPTATDANNGLYLILEDGSSNEYVFGQSNTLVTTDADFNAISQTMAGTTVITVIKPDFSAVAALSSIDVPTITITDSYTSPDRYYTRKIDITGLPTTYTAKLDWVLETHFRDSSSSAVKTLAHGHRLRVRGALIPGTTQGYADAIDVAGNNVYQLVTTLSSAWDHVQSGGGRLTYIPFEHLGDFRDVFYQTSFSKSDVTQVGVEWDIPAGDTSYSAEVQHGFYNEPQYVTALYQNSTETLNTGDTRTLEINITNLGLSKITGAAFDYTLDPELEFVSYDGYTNVYSCLSAPVVSSIDNQTINFSNIDVATTTSYNSNSRQANPSECMLEITVKVVASGDNVAGTFSNLGSLVEKEYPYLDDAVNADDRGNVLNPLSGDNSVGSGNGGESEMSAVPSASLYSLLMLIFLLSGLGLYHRRR